MKIALLALALALACAAHAQTLRYATGVDATTLDPHAANLLPAARITASVYESLVARDAEFRIVPGLAVSWTQPDPLTWRFKLRPGVKFHDGSPFTAADVVFSVERSLHPLSQLKASVEGVEKAVRVDDLTVDLKMREPNPVLLNHLFQLRVMSRAWAEKNGVAAPQNYKDKEDTFASRNTNGTGPFMVTVRQPDVKTVLIANPNWWNKASPERGNLKEVVWQPITSNGTRMAALVSGEIDFVIDPPVQDIERMKSVAQIKIAEGREGRVAFIGFDVFRDELQYGSKGRNPFKDLRVRQAVALAIDVGLISDKIYRGLTNPTFSIVAPGVGGYAKDVDVRPKLDRERAKKLLAEAGYANGFDVTIDCGNQAPASDACQSLAPMLAQVGIRAAPALQPAANFFPKLQRMDTSMFVYGWGAVTYDALYVLQSLLYTRSEDGSSRGDNNIGRWSNAEFDKLVDRLRVETDLKKRDGLIRDALAIVAKDMPIIPLHQAIVPWAMRKNVEARFAPNNIPYFFRFSVK